GYEQPSALTPAALRFDRDQNALREIIRGNLRHAIGRPNRKGAVQPHRSLVPSSALLAGPKMGIDDFIGNACLLAIEAS
ncbi:hypothetical protein QP257_25480, partial [Escherichia coli]|nr:hypothetical protein [Escherichia coli]